MKLICRYLLSFVFILTNTHFAFSKTKAEVFKPMTPAQQLETVISTYLQLTQHVDQIKMLLSLAKVDSSEIQKMTSGFAENDSLPKMDLVKNEITFEGEGSGIKITSYDPLTVEYKNKTWLFNPKNSPSENYSGLMKILEQKKTAGLFSLFINKAEAQQRKAMQRNYRVVGAIAGAALVVVGGGIALAVAGVTLPLVLAVAGTAVVAGAIGGRIGAKSGYEKGYKLDVQAQRKAADELLRANDLTLECTKSGIVLSGTTSSGKTAIRFDRSNPPPPPEPSYLKKSWNWILSWFDSEPKSAPGTTNKVTHQSISANGNYGNNISETVAGQALPKNHSFDRTLSFTKAQDDTLKKVINCESLDAEEQRCSRTMGERCAQVPDRMLRIQCLENYLAAEKRNECDSIYRLKLAYLGFLGAARGAKGSTQGAAGGAR